MGCLLPDQAFVRLRNRTYGMYLYAHEDGAAVVLKPHRACLQTVWQLHRILRADRNLNYILFRSAAYGRYLTLSRETSPIYPGHSHQVNHTFQGVYETPMQDDVLWVIACADNLHAVIFHATYRVLRSSPSNMLLFGHAFVVGDIYHPVNYGTTIHWTVEEIPVRPEPPVIHLPTDCPFVTSGYLARGIIYMRADDHGNVNPRSRGCWLFYGNCLLQLRADLAKLLKEPADCITLCVRAGSQGRLTPLVIDLPSNDSDMEIIVLTTMSPAVLALRHPDVDAW
ncbi:uncharacterized protein LOC100278603 [Zea mays]|uniref:DUF569 domain-containing protein n=1 Tax=Zea mays TaxID=4577 RepID=B6UB72_MAIZE|nr:uncharacterized protein LOC100278603 [Zea mays]ACG46605.1 hypothetical protein [Zea mays]|eukprot:NP_001145299.1 uncharacterized protein LOC100278603 [Zea mays]